MIFRKRIRWIRWIIYILHYYYDHLPVPACSNEIILPHKIGFESSHVWDVRIGSLTTHIELGSPWELVAVTDCCPLPDPQAMACECKWYLVSLWTSFIPDPHVTGLDSSAETSRMKLAMIIETRKKRKSLRWAIVRKDQEMVLAYLLSRLR